MAQQPDEGHQFGHDDPGVIVVGLDASDIGKGGILGDVTGIAAQRIASVSLAVRLVRDARWPVTVVP